MESCVVSIQSCWSHVKRDWTYNTVNIHTMVEGTTMTFTGAIQLAYNRNQHTHRQPGNQKCAHCMSTNYRSHHTKILQIEQTHQGNCILQEIHKQLQTSQGQQAINYPLHTRSRRVSNLLCEDGTTNFLCTKNKEFNGTTRGFSQQFSQDTSSLHR